MSTKFYGDDEEVARAREDIRFVRACGYEVRLIPKGDLGLVISPSIPVPQSAHEELNERVQRLRQLDKTESGWRILRDALDAEQEEDIDD